MDTARIAALLAPFLEHAPSVSVLDQISTYIDLLSRWNARINLTAIRRPEEIVTRHFGESLFLARHLFPDPAGASFIAHAATSGASSPSRVLDIGSGAGFPALPMKIWAPEIRLTLIESNNKKAAFLREVARALILTDVNVITDRAETLCSRADFPRTDVVTLRAVESFTNVLPQAISFLNPKGIIALLIGADQVAHLATLTGMNWKPPIAVPESMRRVLAIGVRD